jgi:glycosyltransferase involved in cell wall biosynthesis
LKPAVTIAIPTYNGQKYLEETLESAIRQSYPFCQILVVDDGSTDDTLNIVNDFAIKFDNIRVVRNKENLGIVPNWNRCLELAETDWVKILHQDDLLEPNCVEEMMYAVIKANVSMAICNRDFIIEQDTDEKTIRFFKSELIKLKDWVEEGCSHPEIVTKAFEKYKFLNIFGEPTTLIINKSIIKDYGTFNVDIHQLCDFEFILRYASNIPVYFINRTLCQFRVHGRSQSTMNNANRFKAKTDKMLILHEIIFSPYYRMFRSKINKEVLEQLKTEFYLYERDIAIEFGYFKVKKLYKHLSGGYQGLRSFKYPLFTKLKHNIKKTLE